MARDGAGVYSKPANTTAVTDQTITAALWNTMIDDLVADANLDRPVAAGGTGASTAAAARTNLGVAAATDCILADGSSTVTANIPMSGYKLTGLAAGSTSGDSVRYEQVVRLADDQTVAGVKTFSNNPVVANTSPRLRLDDTDGPSGRRMVDVAISDGTVQIILRDSAGTLVQTLFTISTTSSGAAKFNFAYSGIPLYANNAAARADGLDDGDLYRVSGGGLAVTTP